MALTVPLFIVIASIIILTSSTNHKEASINIKPEASWSIEPYLLPIPTRRPGAAILNDALYLFGGLTSRPDLTVPLAATAVRSVFKLDLSQTDREWETVANISEDLMPEPWFGTGRDAHILSNDKFGIFLTCEDSGNGHVYRFDTKNSRYEFDIITTMQDLSGEGGIDYRVEDCCSVSVGDKIYIIGGSKIISRDPVTNVPTLVEEVSFVQIYNVITGEWSYGESLPINIQESTCENVNDEYIFVFGGSNNDTAQSGVYRYDINNDIWNEYNDVLSVERLGFGSVYVPNTDYVVLIGGETDDGVLDLVEVYDISTNTIDSSVDLPQLNLAREGAVIVIDTQEKTNKNTIYVIGGEFIPNLGVYDNTETLEFEVESSNLYRYYICNMYIDDNGYNKNKDKNGYVIVTPTSSDETIRISSQSTRKGTFYI